MSDSQYHNLMRNSSGESSSSALQNVPSSSTLYRVNIGGVGEIQHSSQILDQVATLLHNETCSDVTLIVDGCRLPAHRLILGMRSSYFWAMMYTGMLESTQSEITLVDTNVQPFKILLKYIYTGRMQLHSMNFELIIEVLALVHKYGFVELESEIADYLKSILNTRNVCCVYATAHLYSMNALLTPCLDYIDNYAAEILTSQSFIQLPMALVQQLISRNSFCAPEIDIFSAIARWIEAHPEELDHFEDVLSNIRLPLIKLDDLLNIVRPSSLIEADKLLDAISEQSKKRTSDLVYRGILCPMINVAEPSMNAKVLTGEYPTALLMSRKGFTQDYDRKFTRHAITADDPGITIELGRSFIINHIKLWLPDREQRNQTYSYYVEVSMDQKDWVRVIDHTQYLCRSVQNLFFRERVVKYVRIVGTYNSLHGTFNLMGFEAFYTTQSFEVDPTTTLLIPRHNVATETPGCATVIEGVSKSRNVLLDGNTDNYDWDDGYTCHQLGSGAITIQFPQPYMLNSLRLLLWDCDERTYSFYIEASCDQVQWTKIVDANRLRSWQTFTFKRIPVVFIRIVGTANSANEVFHLVHFETPAQVKEMDRSILHLDRNDACSTSRDEHRSQTRSPNAIDIQPDPVVEDNLIVQPIDALEMREDDEEVANEAEEVNVNEE